MFLPHFDVFSDLLLNRRTATWNVFVLYNKEATEKAFFYFKNFSISLESQPLPILANTRKSHLMLSIFYTKGSNLIGCYA